MKRSADGVVVMVMLWSEAEVVFVTSPEKCGGGRSEWSVSGGVLVGEQHRSDHFISHFRFLPFS